MHGMSCNFTSSCGAFKTHNSLPLYFAQGWKVYDFFSPRLQYSTDFAKVNECVTSKTKVEKWIILFWRKRRVLPSRSGHAMSNGDG